MNRYISVRDVKSFCGESDNFLKIHFIQYHEEATSIFSFMLYYIYISYQSKTGIRAALHLLLLKLDACIQRNELRFETLNLSIQMSDQWNQFNIYLIHHKLGQLKQKLWSRNMSALNTFQSPLAFNNH